jgi:hypothetical protein
MEPRRKRLRQDCKPPKEEIDFLSKVPVNILHEILIDYYTPAQAKQVLFSLRTAHRSDDKERVGLDELFKEDSAHFLWRNWVARDFPSLFSEGDPALRGKLPDAINEEDAEASENWYDLLRTLWYWVENCSVSIRPETRSTYCHLERSTDLERWKPHDARVKYEYREYGKNEIGDAFADDDEEGTAWDAWYASFTDESPDTYWTIVELPGINWEMLEWSGSGPFAIDKVMWAILSYSTDFILKNAGLEDPEVFYAFKATINWSNLTMEHVQLLLEDDAVIWSDRHEINEDSLF